MRKFPNAQELAQTIDLYKRGKITKFSLEKELTDSLSQIITGAVMATVEIEEAEKSSTNSTFLISTLPEMGQNAYVRILVDERVIKSLLTPEEVIKVILVEAFNTQSILKIYSNFLNEFALSEVSLTDTLMMFLEIYKTSLSGIYMQLPDIAEKLSAGKSIPSLEDMNEITEQLSKGEDKLDVIVERLSVNDYLPSTFVKEARNLTQKLMKEYNKSEEQVIRIWDEPEKNVFTKQRSQYSDGTYEKIESKQIAHDYKPETNLQ